MHQMALGDHAPTKRRIPKPKNRIVFECCGFFSREMAFAHQAFDFIPQVECAAESAISSTCCIKR